MQQKEPAIANEGLRNFVVVGGSAGSLETMRQVLKAQTKQCQATYLFIQHLSANIESSLCELLANETDMPVSFVQNDLEPLTNYVYVLPPNFAVTIEGAKFKTRLRDSEPQPFNPIDTFLKSLASAQSFAATVAILSGYGSDGEEGIRQIKSSGGIVLAQKPETSEYPEMPKNAIKTKAVDFVLDPSDIGPRLCEILKASLHLKQIPAVLDSDLNDIFELLNLNEHIDFRLYKTSTIKRRLIRRMALQQFSDIKSYFQLLKTSKEEQRALINDVLIGVTEFFRDRETFDFLQNNILPAILRKKSASEPIRIWVAGCSTGEEAFTFAILSLEVMKKLGIQRDLKIFGTDLSPDAITAARQGTYRKSSAKSFPETYLRSYFISSSDKIIASKLLRDPCVFAVHNILSDPPLSNMDLVSCRNTLIYFDSIGQSRALANLEYSLRQEGFLLLSPVEEIDCHSNTLSLIDRKLKLFQKTSNSVPTNPFVDTKNLLIKNEPKQGYLKDPEKKKPISDFERKVQDILLSKMIPAAIVINDLNEVVYLRGNLSEFMSPLTGSVNLNIYNFLHIDLHSSVRRLFTDVKNTGLGGSMFGVKLKTEDRVINLNIHAYGFAMHGTSQEYVLLCFQKTSSEARFSEQQDELPKAHDAERLERELNETKLHMKSILDDYESTEAVLRANANEIALKNEELRSANEELQTSQEEIQSSNEELKTLNDELFNNNRRLNEINDDLENLQSSIDIPIIILSKDLKIKRHTREAKEIFSVDDRQSSLSLKKLTKKFCNQNIQPYLQKVLDTSISQEVDAKCDNGKWFSMRIKPYYDSNHKADGIIIACHDITLRKTEEEKIKSFLDTSPDAVLVVNKEGQIIYANHTVKQIFGWENKDLFKQKFENLIQDRILRPETRQVSPHSIFKTKKSKFESHCFVMTKKSGEPIQVEANVNHFNLGDELVSVFCLRDISLRSQAQHRIRIALEAAPVATFLVSPSEKIEQCNLVAQKLFGYGLSELKGNDFAYIVPKSFRKSFKQILKNFFKNPRERRYGHQGLIITGLKADGGEFPIDITMKPLYEFEKVSLICSIQDIKESYLQQKELKEAKQRADAANIAKSEFLANMSHEIRTPISAIVGFAQRIAEDLVEPEEKQLVCNIIRNNAINLQHIIDDILDISKIESGTLFIETSRFQLTESLKEIELVFSRLAAEKGLQFSIEFGSPIPSEIELDPTRFNQILTNLLNNAFRYTSTGFVKLNVELLKSPHIAGSGVLQFDVIDSGIGIARKDQDIIFNKFSQADVTVTRKYGGTGLGLTLSRKLAQKMGGDLVLHHSEVGKGSTFRITLAIEILDHIHWFNSLKDVPTLSNAPKKSIPDSELFTGLSILVTEDSKDLQELITTILKEKGALVDTAENGEIALEKALANHYDLILMDIQMPIMDGYKTTKALRERGFSNPIIATTARSMPSELERCLEAGCTKVLCKPINFANLFSMISEVKAKSEQKGKAKTKV